MELRLINEMPKEERLIMESFERALSDFLKSPCSAETRLPMYEWYNKIERMNTSFFFNEYLLVYLSRKLAGKMSLKHRQQLSSLLDQVINKLTINRLWRSIGQESQAVD